MNMPELKTTAGELRRVLNNYVAIDTTAAALLAQLENLLDRAERGAILQEVEIRDIPGYKILTETELQQHNDLSEAYAAFYIELTGGESDALRLLKSRHQNRV